MNEQVSFTLLLKVGQTTRDVKQRVAEQAGEPKGESRDTA